MARSLIKSPFVLFALGLLIFASSPALAKDDNLNQRKALGGQMSKLYAEGKYQEAIPLAEKLVALTKRAKGDEDPDTARSLFNLAALYDILGDFAKAEPLLKEALAITLKVLGPEHPFAAEAINNLAYFELDLGETQEARQLSQSGYASALKGFSKILSFGSEDQRLAYEYNHINAYTLFAELDEPDALVGAVLQYKGVVLDSIIEDRSLAETSKEEANRDLVQQLYASAPGDRQRVKSESLKQRRNSKPDWPRVMRSAPRGAGRSVDRGACRPAIEPRKL